MRPDRARILSEPAAAAAMSWDLYLVLMLALTGLADIWCERLSGEGLIGRALDLNERARIACRLHGLGYMSWARAWNRARELR